MWKEAPFFIVTLFLTGCVAPIPLQEQIPSTTYQSDDILVVSVVDTRRRVEEGKPRNFVGIAHGAFGIPSDWHCDSDLSVEEGDDKRNLSQFLQHRVETGLKQHGWNVQSLELETIPSPTDAQTLLNDHKADTLLVLQLIEWYFSINLAWVSAFNFDTNTNVIIYQEEKGRTLHKNFSGRDIIDEKMDEAPQNLILMAYRDQLNEILNDSEVKAALLGK